MRYGMKSDSNTKAKLGTKENMYCSNRLCPYSSCLRHNKNTPYGVLIWREQYELDKNGECEYRKEI